MKKTALFFLFFFFLFSLSAETLHTNCFDSGDFVSDINSSVASESPELLVKAATLYLSKMQTSNLPNCFGCSFHLIKATEKSSPEMQLAAADLAVKFSNDLPEIHHHYIVRLIHFAPTRIDKIALHFLTSIDRSLHFSSADSVTYLVIEKFLVTSLIFFAIFIFIMFLKYTGLIVHRYKHLVGFSKFYAIILVITFSVSVWLVLDNFNNTIFILIPFLLFFGKIGTHKERIILYITVIFFTAFSSISLLVEKHKASTYDQNIAYNHFLSVVSPDLLPEENIDFSQPGAYMAKGFIFLYNGNFNRAAFNLKKELSETKMPEIRTMLLNAIGIALASNGNPKEALSYLKEAYEITNDPKIGYNLAQILYKAKFQEESAKLEKRLIYSTSSESFSYPYIHISAPSKIWKYLCYGDSGTNRRNIINSLCYIAMAIAFYIFMLIIRYFYFGNLKISGCLECGNVICSKCTPGGNDICAVCKLMKLDPSLFKRGEQDIYEKRRNNYFKRRSLIMNILTFTIPGGGLIFIDRIFEGAFYILFPILTTILYSINTMGLVVDATNVFLLKFAIISIDLFIYCISVIRTLLALRRN